MPYLPFKGKPGPRGSSSVTKPLVALARSQLRVAEVDRTVEVVVTKFGFSRRHHGHR